MNRAFLSILLVVAGCGAAINVTAQTNEAIVPVQRTDPRSAGWLGRHEKFVELAKKGGVDLLFLGDSITDNWRSRGSNVWNQYYGPRHAANFGIGGDRTQHLLWRIENGELDGIKPKVTVLMIGTNNGKADSADDIAAGIKRIIQEVHSKIPGTKILLLGIFPRNRADDPPTLMPTLKKVNEEIAGLDDGKTIRYLDIGSKFLGPDGKVPADIMPDYLHPNERGYQIWAEAMEPTLGEMLK